MSHPLQCRCGTLRGQVDNGRAANRVVCYCKDCQAFAHFLGRPSEILDERGGSEIVQVLPRLITFTQGIGSLACMRLTPKGLLRWYAACCNTPLGNTLATPKFSFIGLVHNCLDGSGEPLEVAFGPIRAWVHTQSAKGDPKPVTRGMAAAGSWFLKTVLRARFSGDYKQTPFFHRETGLPIASAKVLSPEEHANIMGSVRAATG